MFEAAVYLRRRVVGLLVLALVGLAASTLWPSASAGARTSRAYVVLPGDTLWSIAARAYRGDPRDGVAAIQRANGLSGAALAVGQRLVLP